MLVGTPRPVNLSVFVALGPALWIRLDRVALPVLRDLLADAWRTVAPKRLAAAAKTSGTKPRRLTRA